MNDFKSRCLVIDETVRAGVSFDLRLKAHPVAIGASVIDTPCGMQEREPPDVARV
jgi:hypothetical protein